MTKRGAKHLLELDRLRQEGYEAAVLFCVQRQDADAFAPAEAIDPEYARTLYEVHQNGVRVLAYQADVQPDSITLVHKLRIFD